MTSPADRGRRAPRIVHVTTSEISLALLLGPQLEAFAAAGYEVVGASAPGPYVAHLEAAGIRHYPLRHATRAMDPRRDLAALVELARLFRRLRPDVVHTHNPKPGVYGRVAARASGVPVIVNTVHGLYALPTDPPGRRAAVYALERVAAACSDAELLQNPEDLPTLRRLGIPSRKLQVLGNGIDLDRFDPQRCHPARIAALRAEWGAGPDDVVVGAVGRLVREKGYRELFEAALALRAQVPNLRVVVAGPSDDSKADALNASDLAVAARAGVCLLGMRDDVEALYAAFDCYVLASYREGFPRSAMEAAAMGLPIVATDVRGCRQVVEQGRTGLLVPARDASALAAAIGRLGTDPGLRRSFGAAARDKARREFDQRAVIATTLATYARLLARAGRSGPAPDPGGRP